MCICVLIFLPVYLYTYILSTHFCITLNERNDDEWTKSGSNTSTSSQNCINTKSCVYYFFSYSSSFNFFVGSYLQYWLHTITLQILIPFIICTYTQERRELLPIILYRSLNHNHRKLKKKKLNKEQKKKTKNDKKRKSGKKIKNKIKVEWDKF